MTVSLKLREGAAAWREVKGETIVFDFASSTYLGTNATGSLLWEALAEGTTREALISRLVNTYDIDENVAAVAVDTFVAACRDRDLLTEA